MSATAPKESNPEAVDDPDEAFLQEALKMIETTAPGFFEKLDSADRRAILNLTAECRNELQRVAPELQRIDEARQAYRLGFNAGIDLLVTNMGDDLTAYAEELKAAQDEQMMLIDSYDEESAEPTVHLRDSPPGVAANSENQAPPQGTSDVAGYLARTVTIFWHHPHLVAFEAERRPLVWCLNVPEKDRIKPDPEEDIRVSFHGMPLFHHTEDDDRLICTEVVPRPDPRLPVH